MRDSPVSYGWHFRLVLTRKRNFTHFAQKRILNQNSKKLAARRFSASPTPRARNIPTVKIDAHTFTSTLSRGAILSAGSPVAGVEPTAGADAVPANALAVSSAGVVTTVARTAAAVTAGATDTELAVADRADARTTTPLPRSPPDESLAALLAVAATLSPLPLLLALLPAPSFRCCRRCSAHSALRHPGCWQSPVNTLVHR